MFSQPAATAYTLRRSKRRTLSLEITPEAGVLVRAPNRMPQWRIDAFVQQHARWIEEHLQRQRRRLAAHPPVTEEEAALLRQKAQALLPGRVSYYSRQMNLFPTGISITSAKTRFGSCSGKNRLCFSWRLMQYPPEAIDYVVVHELAHIAHKNHGPQFYDCIARILPDYKQRQAMLKELS